ncbi:hypothetical protein HYFRA_00005629 [Hymenoscyphus fraxineus]|uniref:Rhodopsin domain-containing protein n=1 Tax=Hymenoscyphus fraxineus TaxID=746836 RepID=A0A9N9KTG7_9HELO|nr:hypothetical protein HYFRA_00005629 [Hymenoscyphus fraxineus]
MLSIDVEAWIWFGVATAVLILRYVSRWQQLGSITRYQAEDYVMVVTFLFYTQLIVVMRCVAHLDSNLILPEDIPLLTPESTKSRIRGSKLVLVVEQSMIATIWGCKISLLLMYNKMTMGLKQQLAVKIVAGYVLVSFVIMEILYFGVWCRPFKQYWQVPPDNEQCSTAINHLITNAVFNITTDLMMLCIPMPILISSQLPRSKKIILCGLFGMGGFVIFSACLNKYWSFTQPFSPTWTYWYIREASTAILVANIPLCWTLIRRMFKLPSFLQSTAARSRSKSHPITRLTAQILPSKSKSKSKSKSTSVKHTKASQTQQKTERSWWDGSRISRLGRSESEEYIVSGGLKAPVPLEVWETTVVDVEMSARDPREVDVEAGKEGERGKFGISKGESKTVVTAEAG